MPSAGDPVAVPFRSTVYTKLVKLNVAICFKAATLSTNTVAATYSRPVLSKSMSP